MPSMRALLKQRLEAREVVLPLPTQPQPLVYQGTPRLRKKGEVVVSKPPAIPVRTTIDRQDQAHGCATLRSDAARVLDRIFGDELTDYRGKTSAATDPDLADLQEFRREHEE